MASKILVIFLALIAGYVSYRQFKHGDRKSGITWACIVAYWVVLTIKNLCDLLQGE